MGCFLNKSCMLPLYIYSPQLSFSRYNEFLSGSSQYGQAKKASSGERCCQESRQNSASTSSDTSGRGVPHSYLTFARRSPSRVDWGGTALVSSNIAQPRLAAHFFR